MGNCSIHTSVNILLLLWRTRGKSYGDRQSGAQAMTTSNEGKERTDGERLDQLLVSYSLVLAQCDSEFYVIEGEGLHGYLTRIRAKLDAAMSAQEKNDE